ncbi:hypothetical protein HMPREF0372_04319 [Flavonifractor plautii ATCC 29863]|uniref:Uncharacterized protein n=1 Tax=Flavonifractor plautii ATCC 29863 TaxID=411475 RepID=G9YXQ2_FLAPL|nr:hypothetical protein HMPREF0372_04319 [Flavonifractor plautii ATCC 29863]
MGVTRFLLIRWFYYTPIPPCCHWKFGGFCPGTAGCFKKTSEIIKNFPSGGVYTKCTISCNTVSGRETTV